MPSDRTSTRSIPGLRVRRALRDDAESIARIDQRSRAEAWSIEAYKTSLASDARRCWVAEREADAEIVGFLLATLVADQAEVDTICVDPEHRRCGIASALLGELHHVAKQEAAKTVFLDVRSSNLAANALYASFGYLPVGTRRRYYQDGEDALCLRLDLDGP